MTFWWLSFAGDDGFRGGCVVGPTDDFLDAVQLAHRLGINPGGEVCGVELDGDIPEKWRDKLLDEEDIQALDRAMGEMGDEA